METKEEYRNKLQQQIIEGHGKVMYTYTCHWKIVDRLKRRFTTIKVIQIILTAISTVGFLAAFFAKNPSLSWIGGVPAAISLGLNLYMLNFNLPDLIEKHTAAANELWDVREGYSSLITDFDQLSDVEIRAERKRLTNAVSRINKAYPGTDKNSYRDAKKALKEEEEQSFSEGEAEALLHAGLRSSHENDT